MKGNPVSVVQGAAVHGVADVRCDFFGSLIASPSRVSIHSPSRPHIPIDGTLSPRSFMVESQVNLYSRWAAVVHGGSHGTAAAASSTFVPLVHNVPIPPLVVNSSGIGTTLSPVKLSFEDIANELLYWKASVVFFVFGCQSVTSRYRGFCKTYLEGPGGGKSRYGVSWSLSCETEIF